MYLLSTLYDFFFAVLVKAYERRNNAEYKTAKKLGMVAIVFNLIAVTWVVVGGVITVGVLAGCFFGDLCGLYY